MDEKDWIYVFGGTHGEELLGIELVERLGRYPVDRVRSRLAHAAAAAARVRMLGRVQIMAHYKIGPTGELGDPDGDAEDQAVYANGLWLGPRRNDPEIVVADVHQSVVAGAEYMAVGPRTTRADIAFGYEMGYRRCVVSLGRFNRQVQNGVMLENYVFGAAQRKARVAQHYAKLKYLAAKGPCYLADRYADIVGELEFFQQHEVLPVNEDGGRNEAVWEVLKELEAIAAGPLFSRLELPRHIRRALKLGDSETSFGVWNHHNMGPVRPEYGLTRDGRPRLFCFGVIYSRLAPPTTDGPWVTFNVHEG